MGTAASASGSFCLAPKRHDSFFCFLGDYSGFLRNFVLFVSLTEEFGRVLSGTLRKFFSVPGWGSLSDWLSSGVKTEQALVVHGSRRVVLFIDRLTLFVVLFQELKEAFVASNFDHSQLVGVPALRKESFDVGALHRVGLFVHICARFADECRKGHVAVS